MRKIYIFRHGETDWNKQGRFQGRTLHVPLNQTGHVQAQNLAEQLRDLNISRIFTSPALRAKQTAEIVNSQINVALTEVGDLQERAFGRFEGLSFDEVIEKFPEAKEQLLSAKNNDFVSPGGDGYQIERLADLQKRIYDTVVEIASSVEAGSSIAISTHGSALLNLLIHIGADRDVHIKNCEYIVLAYSLHEGLKAS